MKKEKLLYVYIILGLVLNIFIFPIGGLDVLRNILTSLVNINNSVEVKKVVIESDGYTDKSPGSWHMEKSADWTSTKNVKLQFDVDTLPSFYSTQNFDVVMVVDVSTSMTGEKFDNLQAGAKRYINEILADENNRIAIVEYHSDYSVISNFSNDINALTNEINHLTLKCPVSSCTNYYAGLKGVEEALSDYTFKNDRGLVVLFMTDGAANRDTTMIESQYKYLKDKYHSIKIVGIQYEMGSQITSYLKQASDVQYDAYVDDIYDHFYESTVGDFLNYYEKFEVVDYIDNDYFDVVSPKDISVSIGSIRLESDGTEQKVIWTMGPDVVLTSSNLHMEINLKLKDEYIEQGEGYYSTNKGVKVTTKLPKEKEEYKESDQTPVLKYGYKVYYDGNYPKECNMSYENDELHYRYEIVEFGVEPPICDGYKFNGWKVDSNVDNASNNSFIMPGYDVYVKGTWGKTELVKSNDGTIYTAPTLYDIMKHQAVLDNVKSAYVTSSSGINFKSISSSTNGQGVYTIADTAGDKYPIYYYRGAVDDNNVLFAELCWKIVRTTDTGGVKLIYNGKPTEQDGKKICNNTGENAQVTKSSFNSANDSPAYIGYKYGTVYQYHTKSTTSTETIKYGKSFTYDSVAKQYTLTDTIDSSDPSSIKTDLATHHYTCLNSTGVCTSINYIDYIYGKTLYYITISDGKNIEAALEDMFSNKNKSTIETYIENTWYANNMAKYEDYLEDTPWCMDKSYEYSKVNSGWNPDGGSVSKYLYFDTYYRRNNGTPSIKCSDNDALTVANGGVAKPVGLITSDEVIYAGLAGTSTNKDYYLYTGANYWTMSPTYFDDRHAGSFCVNSYGHMYDGDYVSSSYGVRPVISLKSDTPYSDGDGTKENPYIIDTN